MSRQLDRLQGKCANVCFRSPNSWTCMCSEVSPQTLTCRAVRRGLCCLRNVNMTTLTRLTAKTKMIASVFVTKLLLMSALISTSWSVIMLNCRSFDLFKPPMNSRMMFAAMAPNRKVKAPKIATPGSTRKLAGSGCGSAAAAALAAAALAAACSASKAGKTATNLAMVLQLDGGMNVAAPIVMRTRWATHNLFRRRILDKGSRLSRPDDVCSLTAGTLTECDDCGKPTAVKTCKAYILADDFVRVASIAGYAGFPSSVWFKGLRLGFGLGLCAG